MKNNNKLRFALLGAGRVGKIHADSIAKNPLAELVAVAETNPVIAKQISEKYDCDMRSIKQISESRDIDAVVICTPTDTHANLIELFAEAGKAIFCEKPIDLNVARVRECLSAVQLARGRLMVGFNRRFDPDFMAVRKAIDDGRVGRVEMVQITSRDPRLPSNQFLKTSGGILRDMTIHDFDMARYLLGEEPMEISAAATVQIEPELEKMGDYDSVSITMTTSSGQHCQISNSRRAIFGHDQRIEVLGSKGMVSALNRHETSTEIASVDGFTRPPIQDFFATRYAQSYTNEMSAFINAINEGVPPSPCGIDGLIALAMAQAAILSIELGSTVRLNEILN